METLVLLLLSSIACACHAGSTNGFRNTGSDDAKEENDIRCGAITSAFGTPRAHMRITSGGKETKYSEFPWIVALYTPLENRSCLLTEDACWHFTCGGTLINLNVVLTTGSCVYKNRRDTLKARAGDWNLDALIEPEPYQERLSKKIVIHNRYRDSKSGSKLRYDAALLIVQDAFTVAENIGLICLPSPQVASANCKAAGWGVQKHGEQQHQKVLQMIEMDFVDHDQCQTSLRRLQARFNLHESFVCAGGVKDEDTCQGDGGSPLMCVADDHIYARGLTSWGVGCGESNVPGIYTDVHKIRRWVDKQMSHNGFDTHTYTYTSDYVDD